MPHFFLKLIPPRTDFAQTITPEERTLMQQHAAYTQSYFNQGKVLAFGPVLDPEGTYGVAVIQVASLAEAEQVMEGDSSVRAGLNRYTIAPMHLAGIQAAESA